MWLRAARLEMFPRGSVRQNPEQSYDVSREQYATVTEVTQFRVTDPRKRAKLLWLRLPGNPVSDVAPLGRIENLRWLWLDSATAPGMEAWAPAGVGASELWIERVPAQ